MPRIRVRDEDFEVEEIPLEPPSGEGPHTYLWVEKQGLDTHRCAESLARRVGLPVREVGFAGRKDRHALTRQWFSLPNLDPAEAMAFSLPGMQVLEARRHQEKLRLGRLYGNRFRLRIRELSRDQISSAKGRLRELSVKGMPNRFGPQRFGKDGGNVRRGAALLRGEKLRVDRRTSTLMISALQSAVFNEVLAGRPLPAHELMRGDLAILHRSDDWLHIEDPAAERERLEAFELSPSGPIFGTKMKRPRGAVAGLEEAAMARFGIADPRTLRLPRGIRLFGSRRPLRARLTEISCEEVGEDLLLSFTLPRGGYATVLLAELFPEGYDEGPPSIKIDC